MKIHLFKPSILQEAFFKIAKSIWPECEKEDNPLDANMVVIDHPHDLTKVYRYDTIVAVLDDKPHRHKKYVTNVVFIKRLDEISCLVPIVGKMLKPYVPRLSSV